MEINNDNEIIDKILKFLYEHQDRVAGIILKGGIYKQLNIEFEKNQYHRILKKLVYEKIVEEKQSYISGDNSIVISGKGIEIVEKYVSFTDFINETKLESTSIGKMKEFTDKKIAFVAMKFDGPSYKDKRYMAIKEVLEEASFKVIRADEIKSSGPIVDEVVDYLTNADLVVIDSTYDSQSVAYEIGFCHGIKRKNDSIILLRKLGATEIPFNFRHFRQRLYTDLRHLKRVLRDWFSIITPARLDDYGFVFNFDLTNNKAIIYGEVMAENIIQSLKEIEYSGRCEYYAGNSLFAQNVYIVALALKFKNGKTPNFKFWSNFSDVLISKFQTDSNGIIYDEEMSELASLAEIRQYYINSGNVEFEIGEPFRIINESESWFINQIKKDLNI